jgi:TrpR family trp operon transcriptional repressor
MSVDRDLLKIIGSINNLDELESFFEEIFTPGELDALSLRWKLLKDIHNGMTQRKIAEKYSISLCKITRGSKILKKNGSITLKILDSKKNKNKKGDKLGKGA